MRRIGTGAVLGLVLVMAACGGDDGGASPATSIAPSSTAAATTAAPATTSAPVTTAPAPSSTVTASSVLPATTDAPATTASPACSRPPTATGRQDRQLPAGGVDRHYLLYVPASYTGADAALVVNLHGSGSNSAQQLDGSQLTAVADAHGFIVAAPDAAVAFDAGVASGGAWNIPGVPLVDGTATPEGAPDDVAFIEALVDALRDEFCIDRVAVTGTSGGGRMSSYLGCFSDRFDVVAPVAGLRLPDGCAPARPVDVIAFHGTADLVNPYPGGGPASWGPQSVPDAAAAWAAVQSCPAGPASTQPTAGTTLDVWTGCAGGVEVRLHTVVEGGHNWPGGVDAAAEMPDLAAIVGMTTQEIDAGELIWERLAAASPS